MDDLGNIDEDEELLDEEEIKERKKNILGDLKQQIEREDQQKEDFDK